jgi:methyl-accepting chemotaxis protein
VEEGVELVNRAGASLSEIVESIKRVAEIVSDIAAASGEQSTGIDQINAALSQMDVVTQQNSALVEENAAAAKSLEQQSLGMDQQVGFFQFEGAQSVPTPAVVVSPVREVANLRPTAPVEYRPDPLRRGKSTGRMRAALATAITNDPAWKEF